MLSLYDCGLSREEIEDNIVKCFKQQSKRSDYKIKEKHRRLESLRRNNYKARGFQAKDVSERAETENLFIDCIEEFKKEIQKRRSTHLAFPGSTLRS